MRLSGCGGVLAGSIVAALTFGYGIAAGAATADPATSSDPAAKIQIWEGRWKTRVVTRETPFSHAGVATYDATCDWVHSQGYLVCNYVGDNVDPETKARVNDLVIFYFSRVDRTFKATAVDTEGGPHETMVSVEGNVWIRLAEQTSPKYGKMRFRTRYTFVTPEKETSVFDISVNEGKTWTVVFESAGEKLL